jgi:hypothetical protein
VQSYPGILFARYPVFLETYGDTSPLFSAVTTQIHYVPADMFTAKTISEHLSDTTVTSLSVSDTTATRSEHARSLLTPGEILTMGEDTAVILTKNVAPIFARKLSLPAPTSLPAKVALRWSYHPYAYATASACLLLTLTLWPLWHALPPLTPTGLRQYALARADGHRADGYKQFWQWDPAHGLSRRFDTVPLG